jgi:hypothetical protein
METHSSRIWFPVIINSFVVFSICLFYKNNVLLFLIIFLALLSALFYRKSLFKFVLALIALLVGTTLEYGFCYYKWWIYANPSYGALPVWLPLTWIIIIVTTGDFTDFIYNRLKERIPHRVFSISILILTGLFFLYAYFTFTHINWIISCIFGAFLLLVLIFGHGSFNVLYFYIAALAGTLGEIICMHFGAWYYTAPYFYKLGIPLSLPLAWGLSANVIWVVTMALTRLWKKETGFE